MPDISTYVEVDVDEFMGECSNRDIEDVRDWLSNNTDNNHIDIECPIPLEIFDNPHNEMLHTEFLKLFRNIQNMSVDEENAILKITNRLS